MKSINKRLVGCRQLRITLHVSIVTRIGQSWPPPMFNCYTSKKTGKTLGHPQNHGFKSWSNDWDDVGLPPCLGKSPLEKLNPKVARMAHSQHFAKFLSQAHPSISAWDMPAAHRNMAKPMGTLWPSNKVFYHTLSWSIKGLLTTVPPSLEGITFGGCQKHQSSCFLWLVFWTCLDYWTCDLHLSQYFRVS